MFIPTITKNETNDKVAWENLVQVIPTADIALIGSCATGWLRENPGKNNSDLEKELRKHNLNLHLIADINPPPEYDTVSCADMSQRAKYMLVYCARSKAEAMKELLTHASSYEENFSRLDDAGSLIQKGSDLSNIKKENTKPYEELGVYEKLSWNTCSITIQDVQPDEYEDQLNKDMKRFTDKNMKVEQKMVGMGKDGSPVFGMFYQDNLVSRIGIMMGFNDEQKQMVAFVDTQNRNEWTGFMSRYQNM